MECRARQYPLSRSGTMVTLMPASRPSPPSPKHEGIAAAFDASINAPRRAKRDHHSQFLAKPVYVDFATATLAGHG
jgi:hypothetical protein